MGLAELQELRRVEEKTIPGLVIRTPKQRLLNAHEVQMKHPDKHVRWVNIKDPEKAEARKEEGYQRLTSEEGGKQIGDQGALFAIPRAVAEEKRKAIRDENSRRLNAHVNDMRAAAEAGARMLRDQAGLSVSAERLLINDAQ